MKTLNACACSVLLAAASFAAHAEDMSFSYVGLDWTDVDPDMGPTGDGLTLRGSVGFAKNYFAFAEYSDLSLDVVAVGLAQIGLGGHAPINDHLDFVGRAGYVQVDVSVPGFSDTQDGWLVSAGLRGRVGNHVELEGSVMQRDLGNSNDDTVFTVGGRYHFNKLFAIGAEYQTGNDVEFVFAGV